ncbi:MAG: hypothetical protein ACM3SQ_20530 [Betaproteobacteria bacterium]
MRRHGCFALAVAVMSASLAAQSAAPAGAARSETAKKDAKKDARPKKAKSIELVGCVGEDDDTPHQLTITDAKSGSIYRLTGTSLRRYVGQQVEVIGAVHEPPVHVRFGLLPSPNVAAQAGAMDPAQAAVASAPGGAASGTGNVTLPELHVTRLRAARGSCP